MAEPAMQQQSPLVLAKHAQQSTVLSLDAAGVQLGEHAWLGYLNLRSQDESFAKAVKKVTKLELPDTPNTVSGNSEHTLCWLGPDEWLLIATPGEQDELADKLRAALNGQHFAVTDNSSGLTTITISGKKARTVLAKGCPLDLHPRIFSAGKCAQTVLAKTSVLLLPQFEDSLRIIVRRSFADYLWRWLVDAAEEYGLAVV